MEFAAGYLARPLGVSMAHFGDKFGEKCLC